MEEEELAEVFADGLIAAGAAVVAGGEDCSAVVEIVCCWRFFCSSSLT